MHSPIFEKGKFVAFSQVILPSGEVFRREVVAFDRQGKPQAHFPLREERPFVEWRDETYHWPPLSPADEKRGV